MQLSYGSTMLVNGRWEMVNRKAGNDIKETETEFARFTRIKCREEELSASFAHANDLARTADRWSQLPAVGV